MSSAYASGGKLQLDMNSLSVMCFRSALKRAEQGERHRARRLLADLAFSQCMMCCGHTWKVTWYLLYTCDAAGSESLSETLVQLVISCILVGVQVIKVSTRKSKACSMSVIKCATAKKKKKKELEEAFHVQLWHTSVNNVGRFLRIRWYLWLLIQTADARFIDWLDMMY